MLKVLKCRSPTSRSSISNRSHLADLDEGELFMELIRDVANELDIDVLCHKILVNVSLLTHADRGSLFLVKGPPTGKYLVAKLFDVTQNTHCGKVFRSIEGRKIHMTISHGTTGPTFRCRECPIIFARKFHLKLHMATHGAGRHVCARCGKTFAWLKNLRDHEAKCAGHRRKEVHAVGDFHRETCGQGFATERALRNHVARHQTSRHVKCQAQKCKLTSAPIPNRNRQKEKTSAKPERTKQCAYCPMKYVNRVALRNHERRKHWELLGVERATETRGRPKKKKLGRKKVAGPSIEVCESNTNQPKTPSDAEENYEQLKESSEMNDASAQGTVDSVRQDKGGCEHVGIDPENPNVVLGGIHLDGFDEGKVQSDAENCEPFESVDIKVFAMDSSIEDSGTRFPNVVMREVRVLLENVRFPVKTEEIPRGVSRRRRC